MNAQGEIAAAIAGLRDCIFSAEEDDGIWRRDLRSSISAVREAGGEANAIAELCSFENDESAERASRAVSALGQFCVKKNRGEFPPDTKEALTALIRFLNHSEWSVGLQAAFILARWSFGGEHVVPLVLDYACQDKLYPWVPRTLSCYPEQASGHIPVLVQGLRDSDEVSRHWSAYALGKIGPAAIDSLPALLEALRIEGQSENERLDNRCTMIRAAIRIGCPATEILPMVAEQLDAGSSRARLKSVLMLQEIGADAEHVVELLERATRDNNPRVREVACEVLRKRSGLE